MAFYFTCPHCSAQMLVDEHFIGSSGPCRECRNQMTIQQPPDVNVRPSSAAASHSTTDAILNAKPATDNGPLRTFAGLAAIVLLMVVLAVVAERSRPSNITLNEQRKAGQAAGEMKGWKFQRKQAYDSAYRNEIASRFYKGEFTYFPIMAGISFALATLAGFAIQYVLTYVARRIGLLTDVDAIVLGNIRRKDSDASPGGLRQ